MHFAYQNERNKDKDIMLASFDFTHLNIEVSAERSILKFIFTGTFIEIVQLSISQLDLGILTLNQSVHYIFYRLISFDL